MTLTSAQTAEVARLKKDEGLTEEQAVALVTQVDLDVPLGADGLPVVPPVGYEQISPPAPLLP